MDFLCLFVELYFGMLFVSRKHLTSHSWPQNPNVGDNDSFSKSLSKFLRVKKYKNLQFVRPG